MLVSDEAKRSYDAINSITKEIAPNSLVETPAVETVKDPQVAAAAILQYFDQQSLQQFITLASMDRECDKLSIAQSLLDTVAATAMPRPRFEDLKITAEEKHTVEQSYRECQKALQTFTLRLFSYNSKLANYTTGKTVQPLDCLAGLLVGYLNKIPKPVE